MLKYIIFRVKQTITTMKLQEPKTVIRNRIKATVLTKMSKTTINFFSVCVSFVLIRFVQIRFCGVIFKFNCNNQHQIKKLQTNKLS